MQRGSTVELVWTWTFYGLTRIISSYRAFQNIFLPFHFSIYNRLDDDARNTPPSTRNKSCGFFFGLLSVELQLTIVNYRLTDEEIAITSTNFIERWLISHRRRKELKWMDEQIEISVRFSLFVMFRFRDSLLAHTPLVSFKRRESGKFLIVVKMSETPSVVQRRCFL